MNTLPIIYAIWAIVLVRLVWIVCTSRTGAPIQPARSRSRGVPIASAALPQRPQSLDEIRARMQVAKGQEKAALEEMALDIEANTIDEKSYQEWLDSLSSEDPDLWRG